MNCKALVKEIQHTNNIDSSKRKQKDIIQGIVQENCLQQKGTRFQIKRAWQNR